MGGSEPAAATTAPPAAGARQLAALMFSDIVGYTALMGADEARAVAARERHRRLMQEFVVHFRGRWVEEIGDESFTTFPSAFDAVRCAQAVQTALAGDGDLRLRFGIHMGDVLEREGRLFGDAVNVAARIRAIAEPGAIVVSERVWEDVRNHPEIGGRLLGAKHFKNVDHPVRIYALTGARAVPGGRRRWSMAAGVLAAAAAAALVVWRLDPVVSAGPASIAVLPFANVSSDAANEYFADGMTEELLHALAQIEGLKVPSRTSVFNYKNRQKDIRAIGRELKVQTVLEGSVRREGDTLRITAQLVDVADGYHLWSESYARRAQDLFAVQNELARAIVAKLRPHVLPASGSFVRQGTASLEAYDLYLRGRFDYWRQDRGANERSIALLQQATRLDTGFARAHAALAQAYSNWLTYVEPKDAAAAEAGLAAATRALSIDPSLAEAYLARGRLHFAPTGGFAFEPALQDLKRAVELDPNYADAWAQVGGVLYHLGLLDAARQAIERAHELSPDSSGIRLQRAVVDLYTQRFERSLEWAETVPRDFNPTVWYAVTMYSLMRLGRLPQAAARYEEFHGKFPDEGGLLSAMYVLQRVLVGQREDLERDIQNALAGKSPFGHFHHIAYVLAQAYCVAGRYDEAIVLLEQAAADGFPSLEYRIRNPYLQRLHGRPRYEQHLEDVRLQKEALRPLTESLPWHTRPER